MFALFHQSECVDTIKDPPSQKSTYLETAVIKQP